MNEELKKWKLCIHEASHAAVRCVLGLGDEIEYVTVDEDNPHVRPKRTLHPTLEQIITLAGIAGEFALTDDCSFNFGGDDWERAEAWSEDARREAATRSKALVREHRQAISALAELLLEEVFVTGEQVREVINSLQ